MCCAVRAPVNGLQAQGLDGEPTQQRVEDMAASFTVQMRTVQPCGPYVLAGYSFSGLVAFEMAQQLTRASEHVEFLSLLDTHVYCCRHLGWQWRKLRAAPAFQLSTGHCQQPTGAAIELDLRGGA